MSDLLVKPHYLMIAAARKYNTDRDFILGALQEDIDSFWRQGQMVALQIKPPREVARYVVDMDTKVVLNETSQIKDFEINTLLSSALGQSKTYRLSATRTNTTTFEGNILCEICPEFFQMVPLKVFPNPILHAGFQSAGMGSTNIRFSKDYGIVGKMYVNPKSKATAGITTKLIVFQAEARVRVKFPGTAIIFMKRLQQCCCCAFLCCRCKKKATGYLTASELLTNNNITVHADGPYVYFDTDRIITYTGELTHVTMGESVPQTNTQTQFRPQAPRHQVNWPMPAESGQYQMHTLDHDLLQEHHFEKVVELQEHQSDKLVELQELAPEKSDSN